MSIHKESLKVDKEFSSRSASSFNDFSMNLPIPPLHPRAEFIADTKFIVDSLSNINHIFLSALESNSELRINNSLEPLPLTSLHLLLDSNIPSHALNLEELQQIATQLTMLEASESTLKEITWLETFIKNDLKINPSQTNSQHKSKAFVVAIGGGVLLNAAGFIAEKLNQNLITIPTTIVAAADSAIGGLVRINKIQDKQHIKSFYKSVYEPHLIILDMNLIAQLPPREIQLGLSEIIKHGAYQSSSLLEFMASSEFQLEYETKSASLKKGLSKASKDQLLKAICWTVALKNIAIIHDPESLGEGGMILRGGHKRALQIESKSKFTVSHAKAVAIGVYEDCRDKQTKDLLNKIYAKLDLPKTEKDL